MTLRVSYGVKFVTMVQIVHVIRLSFIERFYCSRAVAGVKSSCRQLSL